MENSIVEILGSVDVKITPDFCSFKQIHIFSPPNDMGAEQMFKIYDKNDEGFITCDEVKKLMLTFGDRENVSDAEANEVVEEFDKDGDGKLNFEEFKELLSQAM